MADEMGKDWGEMSAEQRAIFTSYFRQHSNVLDAKPNGKALEPVIESYIEYAPEFLSVEDPPVEDLINELLPKEALMLVHGEPRVMKSWGFLEITNALTTGKPAFGLERFTVKEKVPVLYCSQEDGSRNVRLREKRLLRGKGIETYPELLAFAVHKGINLENPTWQENLLRDVEGCGFRVVIFDPIRRFSDNTDKGPAEVRKVTGFLRELVVRTKCSVIIGHHDVKPQNGEDNRRRSHKASGGDWFAACECPITFEKAGEGRTMVIPEDYKFSVAPAPFTFRIVEDKEKTLVRLIGENVSGNDAQKVLDDESVLAYLAEHPGTSSNGIRTGLKKGTDTVKESLDRLQASGKVQPINGPRKSKLWRIGESWF